MNIVNLITTKNSQLKQPLLNMGFSVNEFDPVINNKLYANIVQGDTNYSLVEISDVNEFKNENFLAGIKWFYENSKLIIFSETMSFDQKKFLLKNGISDCITDFAPERIASYIKSLNFKPESKLGRFIILDDNTAHRKIIHSIIKRFGYETLFISAIDDLIQAAGYSGNIMIMINIGTSGLDLNELIRKSFCSFDIKKNPVIAYKDMDEGIFIHEITHGLNKLTNVIFSPEELYSMLIDILFKKEIASHASPFINSLQYEKNNSYFGKTLQQIYYENINNIPAQGSLFERNTIDSMASSLEMMHKTLVRAEGIIWLKASG
jgi:hypothetical protein